MKTQIAKFQSQLEHEFQEDKDFYKDFFDEDLVKGVEDFDKYLKRVDIDSIDIKWLVDMSNYHYEYSIFKLSQDKKDETLEHLSKSCQYGFLALDYGSRSCGCFEDKNPFIVQNKAVFIMSNLLLTSNMDEFSIVANHLIDSLNGESCIIKKGYKQSSISWMILEMVSLYLDKPITLHKLLAPELQSPFKEVIENFDTDDLTKIEKSIHLLCDAHIAQAQLDYEIHYEEQYGEEPDFQGLKYKELFLVALYQLPFEVLVWLHLRELKGLQNPDFKNTPKEFIHPLLQTKISQLYMNLEKVELNNELIYAKKLIEKLKEQCPDMDKESVENKSLKQATTQVKPAPKTGHYQATLPKDHPQYETLKADPNAYRTYKEGEMFCNDKLKAYEFEKIEWVLVE
jgi:hypothetical protein